MNECLDLCFTQGETASFVFNILNSDGSPFDLTDAEIRSDIKISPEYERPVLQVPVIVSDAINGQILWILNSAQTAAMKNCGYFYDVKVYKNSIVHSAIHGSITVNLGVTR